jgi:hypothetical protein
MPDALIGREVALIYSSRLAVLKRRRRIFAALHWTQGGTGATLTNS